MANETHVTVLLSGEMGLAALNRTAAGFNGTPAGSQKVANGIKVSYKVPGDDNLRFARWVRHTPGVLLVPSGGHGYGA